MEEIIKKDDKNSMKYGKFKEIFVNLENIGNIPDLPVGKIVALNIAKMKKIISSREETLEEILNKFAQINDKGERIGVEYMFEEEDGSKIKKRRELKGYYPYDWVEVEDRDAYDKAIKEYLDETVDYSFVTIRGDKKTTMIVPREYEAKDGTKSVSNVEKETTLLDVLEKRLSANGIAFLLDYIIEIED